MSPHGIVVIVACTLAALFFVAVVRRGTAEERRIKRLAAERRLEFRDGLLNRKEQK